MKVFDYSIAVASALLATFAAASLGHGQAGNYPDRPVTIIADSAPGSSPDVALRFFTDGLAKVWGQQVAVVNHPGANGSVAAHAASEATADDSCSKAESNSRAALSSAAREKSVSLGTV